jgi:hypothetical protein
MVNATSAYLSGEAEDLEGVIDISYGGEDYQTVLGWITGAA